MLAAGYSSNQEAGDASRYYSKQLSNESRQSFVRNMGSIVGQENLNDGPGTPPPPATSGAQTQQTVGGLFSGYNR